MNLVCKILGHKAIPMSYDEIVSNGFWSPQECYRCGIKLIPTYDEKLRLHKLQPETKSQPCCGHRSDCAVHSEPAYPAGECTCGRSK